MRPAPAPTPAAANRPAPRFPDRAAPPFTAAPENYSGFSGAGEPVVGAGLGGWRSGREGVRYKGPHPKPGWQLDWDEKKSSTDLVIELENNQKALEVELLGARDERTAIQNEITQIKHEQLMREVGIAQTGIPVAQQPQIVTIQDAIERAREQHSDNLIFGADVDGEAAELTSNADSPERVFKHLTALAEASNLLRTALKQTGQAKLGKPVCEWLTEQNIPASKEHQKTMEEKREKVNRTWDFGDGSTHVFQNHTKPNEAKAPNQCVRIYFEWCSRP